LERTSLEWFSKQDERNRQYEGYEEQDYEFRKTNGTYQKTDEIV
jgi:hypothetical protein